MAKVDAPLRVDPHHALSKSEPIGLCVESAAGEVFTISSTLEKFDLCTQFFRTDDSHALCVSTDGGHVPVALDLRSPCDALIGDLTDAKRWRVRRRSHPCAIGGLNGAVFQ